MLQTGVFLLAAFTGLRAQDPTPDPWAPTTELNAVLPPWISFDAGFRTRFEGYTGGGFKPDSTDAYIETQFKLGMTIRPTPWLKLFGEGMDARVFDKSPAVPPYQNTWDIRQAYIELGDTEKQMFGLRVGRQAIDFGDQRLVGESPWTNTQRTFDAVRGTFRLDGYRLDLISASVVNPVTGAWDHHQQGNDLHGLYGGIEKLVPRATVEPYVFWRLQPNVKNEFGVVTHMDEKVVGLRWVGKLPLGFDYGSEIVRELGSIGQETIRAWAGHWAVGRTSKSLPWTPRVYGEFNHASGDANPKDGVQGTFDQLYPSGHDKYGMSDQVGWRNMNDFRAGVDANPAKKVTLSVEYNDWYLASRFDALYNAMGNALFQSAGGTAGTHIGQELDLMASWRMFKELQAGAGIGHIFPGDFLRHATPGNPYTYPYAMFSYRF